MAKRLTLYILIGMALGLIVGALLHANYPQADPALAKWADTLKLLPDVFLKLIKMIIAPLVLATIVAGIAGMGDAAELGRIGSRALGWFITASHAVAFAGAAAGQPVQARRGTGAQADRRSGRAGDQGFHLAPLRT